MHTSAAVVILAGAVLVVAATLPYHASDSGRRLMSIVGYLLIALGFLGWLCVFGATLPRYMRALFMPSGSSRGAP